MMIRFRPACNRPAKGGWKQLLTAAALVAPLALVGALASPAEEGGKADREQAGAANTETKPYERVDFQVKGASCVACLRRVAKKLKKARGVVKADVSIFNPHWAVVIYDRKKTTFEKVLQAIKDEPVRVEDKKATQLSAVPPLVIPKAGKGHKSDTGSEGKKQAAGQER